MVYCVIGCVDRAEIVVEISNRDFPGIRRSPTAWHSKPFQKVPDRPQLALTTPPLKETWPPRQALRGDEGFGKFGAEKFGTRDDLRLPC